jgi:hypothetical protein
MKLASAIALFATVAVLNLGSTYAHAADMDDYRATPDLGRCRVVETQTTNRWGTDVTVRRVVCG